MNDHQSVDNELENRPLPFFCRIINHNLYDRNTNLWVGVVGESKRHTGDPLMFYLNNSNGSPLLLPHTWACNLGGEEVNQWLLHVNSQHAFLVIRMDGGRYLCVGWWSCDGGDKAGRRAGRQDRQTNRHRKRGPKTRHTLTWVEWWSQWALMEIIFSISPP